MADPAMRAAISADLLDMVSDLATRADRINGDRRKLWIEVNRDGFRVIRASGFSVGFELLGFGGTIDAAVSRAEDFLADLQVTAESEALECDRLEAVQTAARHAAE